MSYPLSNTTSSAITVMQHNLWCSLHMKKKLRKRAPLNIGARGVVNPTSRGFAALQHDILPQGMRGPLYLVCALAEQACPVEVRARVGLATGRDVAVRRDVAQGKNSLQLLYQAPQLLVLDVGEGTCIAALELDADREVVAVG